MLGFFSKENKQPKRASTSFGNGVACSVDELISLKAQAEKLHFPLKHRSRSQLSGGKRSSLRGRGIDFDEVRAYQAGDEIRSIDWKVTARTGKAHTKVYKEEKEKPVFVLLDLRSHMFFGSRRYFKSVSACHIASLLAWSSIKNGDRFGGIIFSETKDEEIKPKSNNKAALSFIHSASKYSETLVQLVGSAANESNSKIQTNTLANSLEKLHKIVRPGSLIYLISDFHDFNEDASQSLSLMSRHNDLIAVHIYDQLERELPQAKKLMFTNESASENAVSEIHATQNKVRKEYQTFFENKKQAIENLLLDSKVPSIYINTELEAFEQLQTQNQRKSRF
jgi:uncharacterized protein (DUF58 family)